MGSEISGTIEAVLVGVPLARPLPSIPSAPGSPGLFGDFVGTTGPYHLEAWRRGRVPGLEQVINCNLTFTRSGDPKLEEADARHFVWPGKVLLRLATAQPELGATTEPVVDRARSPGRTPRLERTGFDLGATGTTTRRPSR